MANRPQGRFGGIRGLLDRAKQVAEENLPTEVVDAGRRLRDRVVERLVPHEDAPAPERDEPPTPEPSSPDRAEVLQRVHQKADHGLKAEDRLVVIYSTAEERDAVAEIRANLAGVETTIREFDLDKEPQTRKQIQKLSNVMVPPYVFVNGRYWGAQYEIATLVALGDLDNVVANRLDEISDEARRIGNVHESFSDEITVENVLKRWKLGHILCVDDLDAWYEVDKQGTPTFYYQGGPRPVEDMEAVAGEITAAVEADELEVSWRLDPAVSLN